MYILETLFDKARSKDQFINQYKPTTQTLPIFAQIHDELDEETDDETEATQTFQQPYFSDSELSEFEMTPVLGQTGTFAATYGTDTIAKPQFIKDMSNSGSFLGSTTQSDCVSTEDD